MGIFDFFGGKKKADGEKPVAEDSGDKPEVASGKPEPKQSIFARLRSALKRTSDLLNTDIRDLFKAEGRLVDDEFVQEIFAVLVKTDMGVGPANEICEQIKIDYRGRVVKFGDILLTIRKKIGEIMAQAPQPLNFAASGPTVILVVGVNGSGKTTSIAKIGRRLKDEGRSIVLGAGDTFRAAAVEQLSVWANRLGVDIVKGEPNSDPASIAHRAVARAKETNADICLIDTAGRLQTQTNLMQQLEKIHRVIAKQIPEAPHEVLLVLDATAGQNGLSQAQGFSQAAHCTGIVLTKFDGTAKGGVAIPIRQKFSLPVKFLGIGEKETDLAPFDVESFVAALFDE
jgi:fused signal recognition particle receptor